MPWYEIGIRSGNVDSGEERLIRMKHAIWESSGEPEVCVPKHKTMKHACAYCGVANPDTIMESRLIQLRRAIESLVSEEFNLLKISFDIRAYPQNGARSCHREI